MHFSCVLVEGRVFDFNITGISCNLFAPLVYYIEMGNVSSWVVVGNAVFVNCTGDMAVMFFYSIFQTSAGFCCIRKVAIFFWGGPFVDCFVLIVMEFFFRVHKEGFKGVGSFEDDLYTDMSKDFKFLTEARSIENRDENIFLNF